MANMPDRVRRTPTSAALQRAATSAALQRVVARPWLVALRDHIHMTTGAAAAEHWPPRQDNQPPYYNFRYEHILQVERDAIRILSIEHGDPEVVLAAVWAHDRFQPQFEGENHAERAARWAHDYLKFIRFPDSKIDDVCQAIELHSRQTMDIPEEYCEARILWDADHVARTGPADLLSLVFCHSAEDFLSSLPTNGEFPAGAIAIRDFVPLLMERRPQMFRADWFYFDETRRMARERITASRAFLDCLENQIFHEDQQHKAWQ